MTLAILAAIHPLQEAHRAARSRPLSSAAVPSPTETSAAIWLCAVAHTYDRAGEALRALEPIDLEVAPGEFVSIVGPSGCGKTTLLRAVAGLLAPSEGEALLFGRRPRDAQRSREIGLVAQEPGLLPWRTIEANVRLPLEVARRPGDVRGLLGRVGLAGFEQYRPAALSGGMRQRAALARALVLKPGILLMDEPFGALDELSREALRLELLRLWEVDRMTVLFVTHAVREAVLLSDRVIVMSPRPGRILADIPITLPRPRSAEVEDSPAFIEAVAAVRAVLATA